MTKYAEIYKYIIFPKVILHVHVHVCLKQLASNIQRSQIDACVNKIHTHTHTHVGHSIHVVAGTIIFWYNHVVL